MANITETLDHLASALAIARMNLDSGGALPGKDAADQFNDLAFALPANANASYLVRKDDAIRGRLGAATDIWEAMKVMAAMFFGAAPLASRKATRPAISEVLPDPAPASTSKERSSAVSAVLRARNSRRANC